MHQPYALNPKQIVPSTNLKPVKVEQFSVLILLINYSYQDIYLNFYF